MQPNALRTSLLALARNHRWTWHEPTATLLDRLPGAADDRHPVVTVDALDEDTLGELAADAELVATVDALTDDLAALVASVPPAEVAYFSPEFGISDLVPQYSGGLGVLAGDHLKAASDLGTPLVAVGLFYRGGFFRQTLTSGTQGERYETYDPESLGCIDTGVTVTVPVADRDVAARVWRLEVGRVSLLLLDTDLADNTAADRAITDRLYSGDHRHRLEQELVLGAGGARALAALDHDVPVHHLNEGHAGFLLLELLDRHMTAGVTLAAARRAIRPGLVFTTHTPVPAGIDRFEPELAAEHLAPWAERWAVDVEELLALGQDPADDPASFNMAAFCLRAAGRSAGVSKLHGQVSRTLFAGVPGGSEIGSVTNGVHARTWVMPRLQHAFDDRLGDGWENGDTDAWNRVDAIDDDRIRSLRRAGGTDLGELVAARTGGSIDPDALVVGFARRFATYKRATLLLRDLDRLATLLADDDRPVQFVFAGKAHPADEPGKALLAEIVAFGADPVSRGRFVFVPDYDIGVARAMYAGCDVWLNTPIRPHEASGTSGEKAALNGGLNCSISDGWWDEMADGRNGWTIPASDATDDERRDDAECAAVLDLLADDIVPEFHADGAPWSAAWCERVRHNWRTLGPLVTAGRMVRDYERTLYGPAVDDARGTARSDPS